MRAHRVTGLTTALFATALTLSACGGSDAGSLLAPAGGEPSSGASAAPSATDDSFDFGSDDGSSSSSSSDSDTTSSICLEAAQAYIDDVSALTDSAGSSTKTAQGLSKAAVHLHAIAQKASDPAAAKVIDTAAKEFKRGSQLSDPTDFILSDLSRVGQDLTTKCNP